MKINKSFFGLAIIALMVVGCSSSVNESEPGSNISSAVSSTTNNSATVVNSSSSTVSISSDKSSATEHQHTYSSRWSYDDEYHWHVATCEHRDLYKDKNPHEFGAPVIKKKATYEETGIKSYECSMCHYKKEESIPKLEHTYANTWTIDEQKGTHYHACLDEGYEGLRSEEALHTFDNWETTIEPGVTTPGEQKRQCIVCHFEEKAPISPVGTADKLAFTSNGRGFIVQPVDADIEGDVIIPDEYEGMPVTELRYFRDCTKMTSITIGKNVSRIVSDCFGGCSSLANATFNCVNCSVGFADGYDLYSVMSFGTIFGNSALETITFGDQVSVIPTFLCFGCENLTSVTIPASVNIIGDGAFAYCKNLTEINVSESSLAFTSVDGVLYSKDKTSIYCYPLGKTGEITYEEGISFIRSCAFYGNQVVKEIPSGLTRILGGAFAYCDAFQTLTLPSGLVSIGKEAFYSCLGLYYIDLPSTLEGITDGAFSCCFRLAIVVNRSNLEITIGMNNQGNIALFALAVVPTFDSIKDSLRTSEEGFVTYGNYLIAYNGEEENIVIPYQKSQTSNTNFTPYFSKIRQYAFYKSPQIKSLEIPGTISEICWGALYGLNNLETYKAAYIGSSLLTTVTSDYSKKMDDEQYRLDYLFKNEPSRGGDIPSSLRKVVITDYYGSKVVVANSAISSWVRDEDSQGIKEVVFGHGVEIIGKNAVYSYWSNGTKIYATSVELPERLTAVYENAIYAENIYYRGSPAAFASVNVNNYSFISSTGSSNVYFYSETEPEDNTHQYWHVVGDERIIWGA